MKKYFSLLVAFFILLTIVGCARDSEVVSHNISKDADSFKVRRRIVFYNSIQDKYILEMVGNCSINVDVSEQMLEVTCKLGEEKYQKHFLGLSDNVTYTVEQLEWIEVDKYKYEIVFKPDSIIPIKLDVQP